MHHLPLPSILLPSQCVVGCSFGVLALDISSSPNSPQTVVSFTTPSPIPPLIETMAHDGRAPVKKVSVTCVCNCGLFWLLSWITPTIYCVSGVNDNHLKHLFIDLGEHTICINNEITSRARHLWKGSTCFPIMLCKCDVLILTLHSCYTDTTESKKGENRLWSINHFA